MRTFLSLGILAFLAARAGPTPAPAAEPTDALTIRLVRPDQQLERLIALFEGTRAANPAAALAGWKRAVADPQRLGKTVDAAIASLNPGMVRELRSLDRARAGLGLDPADGHVRWYVAAPGDDGSFAALATALVLTDGGQEAPLQGIAIDRLGPPGSAVVARLPAGLALAGARADLPPALKPAGDAGVPDWPRLSSGIAFRLDPKALAVAGPVARRRVAEAVRGAGYQAVEGTASLADQTLTIAWTGRLDAPAPAAAGAGPIDPEWLDWIPDAGIAAAVAIALDPSPRAWDAAFAWADRVEKADPAHAEVAPLRARLNVLALAARVRPEVDLWPRLRGVTACAAVDERGRDRGVLVALHTLDEAAAGRLADEFFPRVAASLGRTAQSQPAEPERPGRIRRLALVSGRSLEVARRGATVLVGWGEALVASSLAARQGPAHPAGSAIRKGWGASPPRRAGAFWPGRIGGPLLADAPPVVWTGRDDDRATHDRVVAEDLHGVVRRFLERLPLDPPAEQP